MICFVSSSSGIVSHLSTYFWFSFNSNACIVLNACQYCRAALAPRSGLASAAHAGAGAPARRAVPITKVARIRGRISCLLSIDSGPIRFGGMRKLGPASAFLPVAIQHVGQAGYQVIRATPRARDGTLGASVASPPQRGRDEPLVERREFLSVEEAFGNARPRASPPRASHLNKQRPMRSLPVGMRATAE